jgi:hypothetical protein
MKDSDVIRLLFAWPSIWLSRAIPLGWNGWNSRKGRKRDMPDELGAAAPALSPNVATAGGVVLYELLRKYPRERRSLI